MKFFQLINVKMPTVVGILTLMSKKKIGQLDWSEFESSSTTVDCIIRHKQIQRASTPIHATRANYANAYIKVVICGKYKNLNKITKI